MCKLANVRIFLIQGFWLFDSSIEYWLLNLAIRTFYDIENGYFHLVDYIEIEPALMYMDLSPEMHGQTLLFGGKWANFPPIVWEAQHQRIEIDW